MPPTEVPVNSTWDMKTPPPVQVAKMSAKAYFELFAKLLKDNPPHELDWNVVEQLTQIGIIPAQNSWRRRRKPSNEQLVTHRR